MRTVYQESDLGIIFSFELPYEVHMPFVKWLEQLQLKQKRFKYELPDNFVNQDVGELKYKCL